MTPAHESPNQLPITKMRISRIRAILIYASNDELRMRSFIKTWRNFVYLVTNISVKNKLRSNLFPVYIGINVRYSVMFSAAQRFPYLVRNMGTPFTMTERRYNHSRVGTFSYVNQYSKMIYSFHFSQFSISFFPSLCRRHYRRLFLYTHTRTSNPYRYATTPKKKLQQHPLNRWKTTTRIYTVN